MKALSLYSGIGGLDLAAHLHGIETVAFCEMDPFCRRVLAHYWPDVPVYERDEDVTGDRLRRDGIDPAGIGCIIGGPPCQAASAAGKRGGDSDPRWRWPEYIRIVGDVKPRWCVAENPTGLLSLRHGDGAPAFGGIVAALSEMGYRVGWGTWGAGDVGAPHRRERVFIIGRLAHAAQRGKAAVQQSGQLRGALACGETVADPFSDEPERSRGLGRLAGASGAHQGHEEERQRIRDAAGRGGANRMADADSPRRLQPQGAVTYIGGRASHSGQAGSALGDGQAVALGDGLERLNAGRAAPRPVVGSGGSVVEHTQCAGPQGATGSGRDGTGEPCRVPPAGCGRDAADGFPLIPMGVHTPGIAVGLLDHPWPARPGEEQHPEEPPRLATGEAERVAKLRALGNAVVPQQAQVIFAAIVEVEGEGGAS